MPDMCIGKDGGLLIMKRNLTASFVFILTLFFVNPVKTQTVNLSELKSGTKIKVRMENEINSESASFDDTFIVKVSSPVRIQNVVVLASDTVIEGRVLRAEKAGIGGKNGVLEVVFETLMFENGSTRNIEAVPVEEILPKKSGSMTKILTVIGATALGGIIGLASQRDNGTLIGAGIGAGAGTGTALMIKGKDVRIETNQEFEIELIKSVTLPAKGY